jgi:hypothetical protein
MLLQISVVQRMKANHNLQVARLIWLFVVANISCSKNESKSQRTRINGTIKMGSF